MCGRDVVEVCDALEAAGVVVWIDGGWGIEALLGGERRVHDDLDAAVALDDLLRAEAALAPLGFSPPEYARSPGWIDERRSLESFA